MKTYKSYFVILSLIIFISSVRANDNNYRGIDLDEYAFGIHANQLNFSNQSPFTLSFWVNIKEFNHSALGTQFINVRNPDGVWICCDWGHIWSTIGDGGSIDFSFRDPMQSSGIPFTMVEDIEFSEGEWVYVSFAYKFTSNVDMAFYVNGKLVEELNTNSSLYSSLKPMAWKNEYIIMIGGPAFNRSPLNAYLDKVQFYNKALSQAEIIESMTSPLLNDASLLGYWDFEEGCTTDTEGYMLADNGTIKSAIYKIISNSGISVGTKIQPFTFGEGVNPESVIQGVEESVTEDAKTKAFVSNGVLYIESTDDITSINIYDSMGREVLTPNPSPVERGVEITLPNVKGVLIIKVNNEIIKTICD